MTNRGLYSYPTGHYYTEGEVGFADGTKLAITHVLPCTPVRHGDS